MTMVEGVRKERAATTRAALIRAARALFARQGYHSTGTHDVVAAAQVTRGALYHHFHDKAALFEAVFREVEEDLVRQSSTAVEDLAGDPWEQLQQGLTAFLRLIAGQADVQRILLLDGPVVLGWPRWREVESSFTLGHIYRSLALSIENGVLRRQPVGPMAHLILAALNEAALLIAHSEDPEATQVEVSAALTRLVGGLVGGAA
jgi:AcrR family transcriptional regulator